MKPELRRLSEWNDALLMMQARDFLESAVALGGDPLTTRNEIATSLIKAAAQLGAMTPEELSRAALDVAQSAIPDDGAAS